MEVPEYIPEIGEREAEAAEETVSTGWISPAGGKVRELEKKFSEFMGGGSSVAVDSGTAALHLAIEALDLPKGSEIIVPDFTYGATGIAVLEAGMKPVLTDVESETFALDPKKVEDNITEKTEAIMVAHLYGRPAEMDDLMEIADRHSLKVIEDAAQALGSEYRGKKAGAIGDIGCFSFAWSKNITTGKGGMVFSKNRDLSKVRRLADYGRPKGERFEFQDVGYNYLMDNIRASIGLEQMERLEEFMDRKNELFDFYQEKLEKYDLEFKKDGRDFVDNSPTGFYIFTDRRDELKEFLAGNNIGTREAFKPLNRMAAFPEGNFETSERLAERGIMLPSHPGVSEKEREYVCSKVEEFFS